MKSKKIFFFLLLLIINCRITNAQLTYETILGSTTNRPNHTVYSVQPTNDGGCAVLGKFNDLFPAIRYHLIRIDSIGDTIWTKSYNGVALQSLQLTNDSGFIMVGSCGDVSLIKTNMYGDTLWTKSFGGPLSDFGTSIKQTSDNGFIIAGHTYSFGAGNSDVYLAKTNSQGELLWTKTFGGNNYDSASCVEVTNDGGYIIVGTTNSFGVGGSDIYLIKTDINGDTIWTKAIGGNGNDVGNSIVQTDDGGFIISGPTIMKVDSMGNHVWSKTYGSPRFDDGHSIIKTRNGDFVFTGESYSNNPYDYKICLRKINSLGDTLWTSNFGNSNFGYGVDVKEAQDGGFFILGVMTITTWSINGFLIKTDSTGNSNCDQGKISSIINVATSQVVNTNTLVSSGGFASNCQINLNILFNDEYPKFCSSLSINEKEADNSIVVTPNPFTSEMLIKGTSGSGFILIYDIFGKEILHQKIYKSETTINTEAFKNGIYVLKYFDETKKNGAIFKLLKF